MKPWLRKWVQNVAKHNMGTNENKFGKWITTPIDDFTFVSIPDNQPPDTVHTGMVICNHCQAILKTGIVNISHHWMHCDKRIDGLVNANNDVKGKI